MGASGTATSRLKTGLKNRRPSYTTRIHFKHLVTTLGEGFPLSDLVHASLRQHTNRRAARKISPATIKKEIATLRAAWNWGRLNDMTDSEWPGRGLVYKKTEKKPPFQTKGEIERKLAAGGLKGEQQMELWDCPSAAAGAFR